MTSNRTSDKAGSINRLSLKECDSDVDDGGLVVVTVEVVTVEVVTVLI